MYKKHIKRIIDIVVSLTIVILLIPAYLIVGALIKLIDKDKMIFTQTRTGLNGKEFKILKFRTMKNGKVTKLGQVLRNTSIDEIPQFINVLKGDMSLVGPRPWVPGYYENFNERQKTRVNVRPGLVGLAQVNGRKGINIFKKIEFDLYYVENLNLVLDLKIILKSLKVIVAKENPECVNGYVQREIEDLKVSNGEIEWEMGTVPISQNPIFGISEPSPFPKKKMNGEIKKCKHIL